jgi:hypothetical protein
VFTKMKWLMEQEGAAGGDWRAALPDDLKNDATLANYKSIPEVAKALVETKALVGRSIRPLGQNATADEKKQFVEKLLQVEPALIYAPDGDEEASKRLFKKLGRPEKPEDYKFDEEKVKAAGLSTADLRALAVTAGLTQAQAAQLAAVMVQANLETKRQTDLATVALKEKWGAAYEERTLAAKAAALKMGLNDAEIAELSPRQKEAFYGVARAVGVNTNEFRQHGNNVPTPLSPQEVHSELAALRAKPEFWQGHLNPAEHERLTRRATELTKMLG